jgi:hypothetical protein
MNIPDDVASRSVPVALMQPELDADYQRMKADVRQ